MFLLSKIKIKCKDPENHYYRQEKNNKMRLIY